MRRSNTWCSDHELELRSYFSGAQVSAAGLHSSLGAQLARMRDGLGPSIGSACDVPPELRGEDRRAAEVRASLSRIQQDGYESVLRAQYDPEPAGRLVGFEALTGGEAWTKAGKPDLRFTIARGGDEAKGEVVAPLVAVLAIAAEHTRGKPVGGIEPDCPDIRMALRSICLTAGGFSPTPGAEKPKKAAIKAAREALSQIGWRTTRMLRRAQRAYAKARSGAGAEEVRAFMAALDAAQGAP
jgi:hypothetical protein